MLHQLRLFFIALQFLTRVAIPRWVGFEPEWLHHSARYFPAVGACIGA
ncbi:MAG: adenosylcobinamide-GDP ribazoletransferase, partial [Burkholderiales bacterium]